MQSAARPMWNGHLFCMKTNGPARSPTLCFEAKGSPHEGFEPSLVQWRRPLCTAPWSRNLHRCALVRCRVRAGSPSSGSRGAAARAEVRTGVIPGRRLLGARPRLYIFRPNLHIFRPWVRGHGSVLSCPCREYVGAYNTSVELTSVELTRKYLSHGLSYQCHRKMCD